MTSVKKNFLYNFSYQILILIIPLITMPYISRVIGAEGVGIYSYTYSIVYYFMMFAMLGLNNYGNRSIAKVRDDKKKLSRTFKEIYFMQLITVSIMIVLYYFYIFAFDNNYKTIAFLQSFYLLSCLFDINWFFFGIEKFKLTVTRNAIIKILSLICIFIFVRNYNDVWIYVLILSASTFFSQILLWGFLKKYITDEKVSFINIRNHFKPCIKLFLPVIAVSIYKVMDKTMLGMLSNVNEVGYYENAERIIGVPLTIIATLGTVMLPRMTNLYTKGNDEKCKGVIQKSLRFIMFLSFAMTFGLIAISKNFSIAFLGKEFEKSGILIILLSVTILFLAWGNVLRTQYLIPKERDKEYIISAFLGAGVNFIMNLIFIPLYQSVGACFGTIAAELIVMLYQTLAIKKEIPVLKHLKSIVPFFVNSIVMFVFIYLVKYLNLSVLQTIFTQILLGISIYFVLNIKYIMNLLKGKKAN